MDTERVAFNRGHREGCAEMHTNFCRLRDNLRRLQHDVDQ